MLAGLHHEHRVADDLKLGHNRKQDRVAVRQDGREHVIPFPVRRVGSGQDPRLAATRRHTEETGGDIVRGKHDAPRTVSGSRLVQRKHSSAASLTQQALTARLHNRDFRCGDVPWNCPRDSPREWLAHAKTGGFWRPLTGTDGRRISDFTKDLARPAGLEPATPGLEGRGYETAGGSVEPLPPFLLGFCHTPNHLRPPRAATDCQSFVSQICPVRDHPAGPGFQQYSEVRDVGFKVIRSAQCFAGRRSPVNRRSENARRPPATQQATVTWTRCVHLLCHARPSSRLE